MRRTAIFWIVIILLIISVSVNIFFGVTNYLESSYTPNTDDREFLAEMTKMVIDHEMYDEIAHQETIYAIEQGVSRYNVADPESIFHYEVYVQTDEQTYIFTCINEKCSDVEMSATMYSRFSDEEYQIPENKNR